MKTQLIRLAAALLLLLLPAVQAPSIAAQTVSPAVGKPLQEAQKALQAKQYPQAMAAVRQAEVAGGLSAYEQYLVARLKASAALGTKDYKTALAAQEQVIASPELPAGEKLAVLDAYVKLAYTAKDYARTASGIQQYKAAGGTSAETLGLYAQSLYLAGRYKEAAAEIEGQIRALEAAGKRPSDTQLQLLASCALKQNDMNAYTSALERLVTYTPKKDYWLDLTLRTAGKPGFNDRLDLDVYRLRKATGTLDKPNDYLEAAQLALQAGFPGEAQTYVDEGYKKQLLGTGADASRHQRLKELVARKIAEDKATLAEGEKAAAGQPTGDALVATGFNYVAYGQFDKGLTLLQQGIAKGGLKLPEHARLHLGYAQLLAGRKADAGKSFAAVKGADGAANLARLWSLQMRGGTAS